MYQRELSSDWLIWPISKTGSRSTCRKCRARGDATRQCVRQLRRRCQSNSADCLLELAARAVFGVANQLLNDGSKVLLDTSLINTVGLKVAMNMRSSAIKIVKRKDRESSAQVCTPDASSEERSGQREIVRTVKTWMAESRKRRQEEAKLALQFMR